jgi:hypothetical protein
VRRVEPTVAAAAVLISCLLVGVGGAAGASGFVSKRYGYEFVPGTGYYSQFATAQWRGTFPFGGGAGVDTFLNWHDEKFIVAAMRVPSATSLSEWEGKHVRTMHSYCKKAHAFRDSTLGGAPAREFMNVCPSYDVIVLTAIHAQHGYIFQFVSPAKHKAAADRRTYETARQTFRFTR